MILVTGGTGLVGSHLLLQLTKAGEKPIAIHRKTSDLSAVKKVFSYYVSTEESDSLFNKIEWREANITDIPSLENAFKEVDRVYHCAALVSFNPGDDKKLRKINITGTANIVNFCIAKSVKKLCYVSSIASLGKSANGPITEKTQWNTEENHSDYAISKYGAEIEVWRGSQEGLEVVILNPGIIIGPGFWNSGSGLIFKQMDNGLNFHFPKITGFVGVEDVVEGMIAAMKSEIVNEQYILVSENKSFKDVLFYTAESLGKSRPKRELKPWMVFIGWILQKAGRLLFGKEQMLSRNSVNELFEESRFSNKKAKKDLHLEFTPVEEVTAKTAEFFRRENPA